MIELMTSVILATITAIILFYLYKQTHMSPFLLVGTLAYIEIPFKFILHTPKIMLLPFEALCVIYGLYYLYITGHKALTLLLLLVAILYLLVILFNRSPMQGVGGLIFSLILLIWFYSNKEELCVDPWGC